jgi:tetratricopeptide (TPR) repeat protein
MTARVRQLPPVRAISAALLAAALGCAAAGPIPAEQHTAPLRATGPRVADARGSDRAAPRADGASAAAAPDAPAAKAERAGAAPAAPALPAKVQRLFEEAVRAEEEQRKQKAAPDWRYLEKKWRAVLEASSDLAEAHHNVGVTLEAQGQLAEARAEYERARELKPTLRQAAVNVGVVLEKQGDARGAAAVYAQCVRDFPEDAVSRGRLAALYRASGQLDDAWRLAREALVRDPRSLAAYKVLARVALQRNDLDLAKLIAMRAQKLDDRDAELPFLVGQVLARQGDDAGARAQLGRALSLDEGFLPARHALLDAALRKRAWGSVVEHADAILKAEPSSAAVHLVRGLALRYTGKPDEALAAYARAEAAAGDRLPEVHLARGVLYARVKSECGPALTELKEYQVRGVPAPAEASQILKLQRDCEVQVEEGRKAAEAAKQMQAEAARQAAEKAAATPTKEANASATPSEGRAPAPTSPHPAR